MSGRSLSELRAPVQTELALRDNHSCKTSSRKACISEVSFALPTVEGCPGKGTHRSGAQTAEHAIEPRTPTNTRIYTAKPIASPFTPLYRLPHVYDIPTLIIIMTTRVRFDVRQGGLNSSAGRWEIAICNFRVYLNRRASAT
jgi:hypothetical protein